MIPVENAAVLMLLAWIAGSMAGYQLMKKTISTNLATEKLVLMKKTHWLALVQQANRGAYLDAMLKEGLKKLEEEVNE